MTEGSVVYFTDLIFPLATAVAAENGVGHWGQVPYAQGGPQLANKLDRYFSEVHLDGVLLADTGSAEFRAVSEVLRRHASVVIRGLR